MSPEDFEEWDRNLSVPLDKSGLDDFDDDGWGTVLDNNAVSL